MGGYWLLVSAGAVVASGIAVLVKEKAWRGRSWNFVCVVILPAIYLGFFREFSVGRGSLVPPSLILVGAYMLGSGVFIAGHLDRLKRFPLLLPMSWYLLAVCLSGWHSVSHLHWARGVLEVGLGFCFLLYPYFLLNKRRQVDLCLNVLLLMAISTVAFAIVQAVFFVSLRPVLLILYRKTDLWWIVGWGWRGRLSGNWLHPSIFGSMLNVAAPFALMRHSGASSRGRRMLFLTAYVILAIGIVLSGTRTPLLAFLFSSVVFLMLAPMRRRSGMALACAVAAMAVLSVFHFRFAPPDVGSRSPLPGYFSMSDRLEMEKAVNTATLEMRWNTEAKGFALFRTSPILGIGIRNYPDRARGIDPMAQYSLHNSLVQNLTEVGLLGLLAFVTLMFSALRSDFRPRLSLFPELRSLRAALFGSSAAILLESLAENSLAIWQVAALFWLIRGISLVISQRPKAFLRVERTGESVEREDGTRRGQREPRFDSLETVVVR